MSESLPDAEQIVADMKAAVVSPTGRLSVGPAFSQRGTYWGVQVYDGHKKVGPFLVASEAEGQSPAGALRSLAALLEGEVQS